MGYPYQIRPQYDIHFRPGAPHVSNIVSATATAPFATRAPLRPVYSQVARPGMQGAPVSFGQSGAHYGNRPPLGTLPYTSQQPNAYRPTPPVTVRPPLYPTTPAQQPPLAGQAHLLSPPQSMPGMYLTSSPSVVASTTASSYLPTPQPHTYYTAPSHTSSQPMQSLPPSVAGALDSGNAIALPLSSAQGLPSGAPVTGSATSQGWIMDNGFRILS